MELHPLPAMPILRAQGEARAVQRGPRTITEILQDARRAMELEDAYIAWLEGKPVPQLRPYGGVASGVVVLPGAVPERARVGTGPNHPVVDAVRLPPGDGRA